jgi:hypothetical protein
VIGSFVFYTIEESRSSLVEQVVSIGFFSAVVLLVGTWFAILGKVALVFFLVEVYAASIGGACGKV